MGKCAASFKKFRITNINGWSINEFLAVIRSALHYYITKENQTIKNPHLNYPILVIFPFTSIHAAKILFKYINGRKTEISTLIVLIYLESLFNLLILTILNRIYSNNNVITRYTRQLLSDRGIDGEKQM